MDDIQRCMTHSLTHSLLTGYLLDGEHAAGLSATLVICRNLSVYHLLTRTPRHVHRLEEVEPAPARYTTDSTQYMAFPITSVSTLRID